MSPKQQLLVNLCQIVVGDESATVHNANGRRRKEPTRNNFRFGPVGVYNETSFFSCICATLLASTILLALSIHEKRGHNPPPDPRQQQREKYSPAVSALQSEDVHLSLPEPE